MAVPKKRMSNSKTASRRAQWDILPKPTIGTCSKCGAATRPHHVCGECGTYRGHQVLAPLVTPEEAATADA